MKSTTLQQSHLRQYCTWGLFFLLGVLQACASGRAMTETELAEYQQLGETESQLRTSTQSLGRQVQKAFQKSSARVSRNSVLSCGSQKSTFETGKVPLVYGAKKRLRFKKVRASKRKGCSQVKVEVKR